MRNKKKEKEILIYMAIIFLIAGILLFSFWGDLTIQEEYMRATKVSKLDVCNYWDYSNEESNTLESPYCYNTPKDGIKLSYDEYHSTINYLKEEKIIEFNNAMRSYE